MTLKPYYDKDGITIYCGDCSKILEQLDDDSCATAITSPPYNMRLRVTKGEYKIRTDGTKGVFNAKYGNMFNDGLMPDDYFEFHKNALAQMMRVCSNHVFWNVGIVSGNKEALFRILGHYHKEIKDMITWVKSTGQPASHDGLLNRASEQIYIFQKSNTKSRIISPHYFDKGELSDTWHISVHKKKNQKGHGAVFPVALVTRILTNFTKKDDVIIDPFLGTGTTLQVCQNEGRQGIGIELSEEYCKIAVERLKQSSMFSIPSPVQKTDKIERVQKKMFDF